MTDNTNKIYQSRDTSVVRNSRAERKNLKAVPTPPGASGALNASKHASTDKYYANNGGLPVSASTVVNIPEKSEGLSGRISTLTDKSQLPDAVTDIVGLLSSGASQVNVPITDDLASQLRTSLEVRVGNEEITREQYNDVVFEILAQEEPEDKECCPNCDCDPCECVHEEDCPTGVVGERGEPGEPGEPGDEEEEVADSAEEELAALESFLAPREEESSRGAMTPVDDLNPADLADLFSGDTAIMADDDDDDDE